MGWGNQKKVDLMNSFERKKRVLGKPFPTFKKKADGMNSIIHPLCFCPKPFLFIMWCMKLHSTWSQSFLYQFWNQHHFSLFLPFIDLFIGKENAILDLFVYFISCEWQQKINWSLWSLSLISPMMGLCLIIFTMCWIGHIWYKIPLIWADEQTSHFVSSALNILCIHNTSKCLFSNSSVSLGSAPSRPIQEQRRSHMPKNVYSTCSF